MLEIIRKNIKHGWLTSSFGVLIIIASIACVFIPGVDWEWDKGLMGVSVGLAFIGMPDPTNGGAGVVSTIVFCLVMVSLVSCNKWHKASTQTTDSTWTKYRKDTLYVKGQSVKAVVNYDSIKQVLKYLQRTDSTPTINYPSSDGKQVLRFTLDSKGNVVANCETADKLIEYLSAEVHRLQREKVTLYDNKAYGIKEYSLVALAIICFVLGLIVILKR